MEAGCVAQGDAFRGVFGLLGGWVGDRAHIVLMPERECDLRTRGFYLYLVKPGLWQRRNCEPVVRRETECANGAGVNAEAAFMSSGLARIAVRVDHLHRENVQRILIGILARLKNLEVALRKIANRIMVLVARHHVDHHLAAGDMEDIGCIGLGGGWSILRGHRKA